MAENVGVIICAAGSSSRFGGKRKKQFTDVDGRAAFLRSIEFFADRDDVKQILREHGTSVQHVMDLLDAAYAAEGVQRSA